MTLDFFYMDNVRPIEILSTKFNDFVSHLFVLANPLLVKMLTYIKQVIEVIV